MGRFRKWAWGLGIASATAVTAFGVASWQANAAPEPDQPGVSADQPKVSDPQVGPEAAAGVGGDALTGDEVSRARTIALTAELKAGAADVTGKGGPEYLTAQIAEAGDRRADVYFYDYRNDKLVKQVVDLKTGKVAGSYAAAGMQMPASEQELSTAFDMLLADPAAAAQFKTAYREATGKDFAGKGSVKVTAHVFKARHADAGAAQCGKHRCLQLVVESSDNVFIDINQIIVDLSGRKIARLS